MLLMWTSVGMGQPLPDGLAPARGRGPDLVMESDVVYVAPEMDQQFGTTEVHLRPTSAMYGTADALVRLVVPVGHATGEGGATFQIAVEGIPLPVRGEHVAVLLNRRDDGTYILNGHHSYYVRATIGGNDIVLGSSRERVYQVTCGGPVDVSARMPQRDPWSGLAPLSDPAYVALSQPWEQGMQALRACFQRDASP